MCSIRIYPSPPTHMKGVAYCTSHIDDLQEKILKAKYSRFTEFNPLLFKLAAVVNELLQSDVGHLDLTVGMHRLKKLQANLEKHSIKLLSARVSRYVEFVEKNPKTICMEYGTYCKKIYEYAKEVCAFNLQASEQNRKVCYDLMDELQKLKRQMDHYAGDRHDEIAVGPSQIIMKPLIFHYASNKTFEVAAEFFSGQLEDLALHIKNSRRCQYIKYRGPVQQLKTKINELASYDNQHIASNIDAMQKRVPEIQTLLEERSIDSLQIRIKGFCARMLSLPIKELVKERRKIQIKFCRYKFEVLQIADFGSFNKNAGLINKLNQILLRVKAAINIDKVGLRARRAPDDPTFFIFSLQLRSASSRVKVLNPAKTVQGSKLVLQEIERLNVALKLLDQKRDAEALSTLQSVQRKIHFDMSDIDLTLSERVLFHFIRSNYVSHNRVRRAIIRTLVELTLAGFVTSVKENGRGRAESVFRTHFRAVGLWGDYCRVVPKIKDQSVKHRGDACAYAAVNEMYVRLKKTWSLK